MPLKISGLHLMSARCYTWIISPFGPGVCRLSLLRCSCYCLTVLYGSPEQILLPLQENPFFIKKRLNSCCRKLLQIESSLDSRKPTSMQVMDSFFENLPKIIRVEDVEEVFGFQKSTVYNWKYRSSLLGVPSDLFIKMRGRLFLRTDLLRQWLTSPTG